MIKAIRDDLIFHVHENPNSVQNLLKGYFVINNDVLYSKLAVASMGGLLGVINSKNNNSIPRQ